MSDLSSIKILYRASDTLSLWGVPYLMRSEVGQQPGDIFRANGAPDDWIYLGGPGWFGSMPRDRQEAVKEFLAKRRAAGEIPEYPEEWCVVNQIKPVPSCSPLLKWAGGKAHLLNTILPEIEDLGLDGDYIEPFVGGGAVGLALDKPSVFNDAIEPLIHFYRMVADKPRAVYRALAQLAESPGVDADSYYTVRAMRPRSDIVRAARFIYLNKLDYNGMYRENSSGEFNVPYGKRKIKDNVMDMFPSVDHFELVAERLSIVDLWCGDFEPAIKEARAGDIVYADPPYDGTFGDYTAKGFNADDQHRLAHALHAAWRRGAAVFASNADTELVRTLYGEWAQMRPTEERRAINADGAGRGPVGCWLIAALPR